MKSKLSFILLPFICVLIGCLNKDKQEKGKFDNVVGVVKEYYTTQETPAGGSMTITSYYFSAEIVEYHDDVLIVEAKTTNDPIRLTVNVPVQTLSPDSIGSNLEVIAQKVDRIQKSDWKYTVRQNYRTSDYEDYD